MKYNPARDIPKAIRELKTFSPKEISQWVKQHRTKKDAHGRRVQKIVSPQAVSMWFKRHQHIVKALKNEVTQELLTQEAISEQIFQNGAFLEIPCVAKWIRDMLARGAKGVSEGVLHSWVSMLRRVCMGIVRGRGSNVEYIEDWGLKHPAFLTIETAKDFIYEMQKRGFKHRMYRIMLRNFLTSKGVVVTSTDISGELEEGAGQYSDLFISKEEVYKIISWLKGVSEDAYVASLFAYTTASRLTATLAADSQFLNHAERTIMVFEKSVARRAKKRCVKILRNDLYELVRNRSGKLFNIDAPHLRALLRAAYKECIPHVADRIPKPFHFWRHMFAQHMLRTTDWNYGLVASLGHWSLEALRRYYGMPPQEVIRKFGYRHLPQI